MKFVLGLILFVMAGFVFPNWKPKDRKEALRMLAGMVLAIAAARLLFWNFK